MRRRFLCALMAAALASVPGVAATGCGRQAASKPAGPPRVALVLKTLNSPYFIDMQRAAEEEARKQGAALVVQAPEREIDTERQMQIVENLIQSKVAALVIAVCGSRELVPALVQAKRAGIPVIVVDEELDAKTAKDAGLEIDGYVGSHNEDGGRAAGRYLVEATGGRATVAILEGIPGHEAGDSRLRGFREAIAGTPGIRVAASQTANWERDQGFNVFQNLLQAHPQIDAVFAANDMMALGAVEAIRAAGRTGRIRVIGFDAIDEARAAIAEGTLAASVAQFPAEMGRLAIESAVKRIHGEPIPKDQRTKIGLVKKD